MPRNRNGRSKNRKDNTVGLRWKPYHIHLVYERVKVGEVGRERREVMVNDIGPSFVRGVVTTVKGKVS